MSRKLVFLLLLLLLVFSPTRVSAYTRFALNKQGTLIPSLAVVLENGTTATTDISVNGTTANATVRCVHTLSSIVNPNFTEGVGTDAYNWTETPSTNIAVDWDTADKNMRFYVEAAKVIEEATCHQDFNYSGTTATAGLTFNYTVDGWDNPPPDSVTLKVQLRVPNTTVFDVWTYSPNGTQGWTWVSLNVTNYLDQKGTYRLFLYLYIDTPSTTKLYSFRWDDVGVKIDTKGMEYDYVLNVVSQKTNDQNMSLTLYDSTNLDRLKNCTIWFYNTTTSVQIQILDGSITMSAGSWYRLPVSADRRIALYVEESNSGTSVLYLSLDAVTENSIIYSHPIKITIN